MLILLFAAALVAFGLSAVSGGGASLLLVPLLAQVLSAAAVPAALSIGTGASSLSRIVVFRRDIRWDVSVWFVPAAVPFAVVGALLLRYLNPTYIQVVMALFLLSNLPQLIRPTEPTKEPRFSRGLILAVGGVAGFLSGLTGAVGVLFNRFYLNHGLSKQEIVATRATNEVLMHAAKLVVYAGIGLIDRTTLGAGVVVGAAAVTASIVLKPVLKRLSHKVFARIGYAAMTVAGVALLFTSVSRVIQEDRIAVDYRALVHGTNARIQWRDSSLELEYEYDDGIVVELGIPLSELSAQQRSLIEEQNPGSDRVAAEAVYEVGADFGPSRTRGSEHRGHLDRRIADTRIGIADSRIGPSRTPRPRYGGREPRSAVIE